MIRLSFVIQETFSGGDILAKIKPTFALLPTTSYINMHYSSSLPCYKWSHYVKYAYPGCRGGWNSLLCNCFSARARARSLSIPMRDSAKEPFWPFPSSPSSSSSSSKSTTQSTLCTQTARAIAATLAFFQQLQDDFIPLAISGRREGRQFPRMSSLMSSLELGRFNKIKGANDFRGNCMNRLSTILRLSAFALSLSLSLSSTRIVGALRLIARALAKSGVGVGCGWRCLLALSVLFPKPKRPSLSFAAFLFPSGGAKWHSKEWIVNFVEIAVSPLFLPSFLPIRLGQIFFHHCTKNAHIAQ